MFYALPPSHQRHFYDRTGFTVTAGQELEVRHLQTLSERLEVRDVRAAVGQADQLVEHLAALSGGRVNEFRFGNVVFAVQA